MIPSGVGLGSVGSSGTLGVLVCMVTGFRVEISVWATIKLWQLLFRVAAGHFS